MTDSFLPDSVLEQARSEAASCLHEADRILPTKLVTVAAVLGLGAATTTPLILLLLPFVVYAFDAMQQHFLEQCADTVALTVRSIQQNGSAEARLALEAWPLRRRASLADLSSHHLLLRSLVQVVALIGSGLGCAAFMLSVTPLEPHQAEPIGIAWLVATALWAWKRRVQYLWLVFWLPLIVFITAWIVLLATNQRIPFVARLTWG